MIVTNTKKIDIAEYLETDDDIREFLQEVAATGDTADFVHALNIAAKAEGMTEVAKQAGFISQLNLSAQFVIHLSPVTSLCIHLSTRTHSDLR